LEKYFESGGGAVSIKGRTEPLFRYLHGARQAKPSKGHTRREKAKQGDYGVRRSCLAIRKGKTHNSLLPSVPSLWHTKDSALKGVVFWVL